MSVSTLQTNDVVGVSLLQTNDDNDDGYMQPERLSSWTIWIQRIEEEDRMGNFEDVNLSDEEENGDVQDAVTQMRRYVYNLICCVYTHLMCIL